MSLSLSPSITSGTVSSMSSTEKPTVDKVTENRIRRMAHRQGLKLQKSPLRDPYALGHGTYRLRREDGTLAAGQEDRGNDYGLSLEEIEAHLTRRPA